MELPDATDILERMANAAAGSLRLIEPQNRIIFMAGRCTFAIDQVHGHWATSVTCEF